MRGVQLADRVATFEFTGDESELSAILTRLVRAELEVVEFAAGSIAWKMRSWPSPRGSRNERFVSADRPARMPGRPVQSHRREGGRQALKSRQFVVTFLLLLLAAWAGSIFGVSFLGESIDYGSSAVTFYAGFLFALCTATLVIVPFSTFRSIIEERTETTLELLQITAISPAQIVRGKT